MVCASASILLFSHRTAALVGGANPISAELLPAPTATPIRCTGDCGGDGRVTINELLTMVNIALTLAPVTNCSAGDANMDGSITINELLTAVIHALGGCPATTPGATPTVTDTVVAASPTASASNTPTATNTLLPTATSSTTITRSATATATRSAAATATRSASATASRSASATVTPPPSATATRTAIATATPSRTASPTATTAMMETPCAAVAESTAGGAVIIANGMGVIPSVVASIVSGVRFGKSGIAAIAPGGTAGMCPRGGTATKTGNIPGTMMISLSDCALITADGLLVVNGTVNLSGLLTLTLNANLQFANKNATGTTTRLTSSATLMGMVTPHLGGMCFLTGADLQLTSGSKLESDVPGDRGTSVTFSNTAVAMSVAQFTTDCVPAKYSLTFDGLATLALSAQTLATLQSPSIPVRFDAFTVSQDATVVPAETSMSGTVTAACFGGAVSVTTRAPLTQAVGVLCPTGGALRVAASTTADVLYLAGAKVGIDTNLDGVSDETFGSCLDSQLTACKTQCEPGATPTRTPNATSTGVATSTAPSTPTPTTPGVIGSPSATPTRTISPTPTATSAATVVQYCDTLSLPAAIPDNDPTGINNVITVGANTVISDLDVRVTITHTYVGDLRLRLTHLDTGTSIRLLDRDPTCGQTDIATWFDDEAGRIAQNECPTSPPALDGSVKPLDPLASVDGEHIGGMWQLNVADTAPQDVGSLLGWCLIVNSPAPVLTDLTCNGDTQCTVLVGDIFVLSFSFVDPNGNASAWRINGVRDDNFTFVVGSGFISPPSGSGTIPVNIFPFTCDGGNCRETEYDYFVTITDTTGLDSPPLRVHIIVPAFGA